MLKISCNDFNIFTHLVEGQSMYVDKRQSIYDCWLLLIKSLTELISPLIKLNINEICGRTATWHFLFCSTCTLYTSSLVPYSCSPFSLFYIFHLRSVLYVFSCLVFFSFYLSVPLSLSHSPTGLVMSTLAFYFKLVWSLPSHLPYFLSLIPLLLAFSPCLSHSLPPDISQSLPLFLSPSHTLYLPQPNPLERFSRWRAVRLATTMWVDHQFLN